MWNKEALEQRLEKEGIEGHCWGRSGEGVAEELERALGIQFGDELREFAINVGNLSLGAFDILVCGVRDERWDTSCVTETLAMRNARPDVSLGLIQIMEYAGQVYCSIAGSNQILVYDAEDIQPGRETREFESLSDLVDWAFEEERLALDT